MQGGPCPGRGVLIIEVGAAGASATITNSSKFIFIKSQQRLRNRADPLLALICTLSFDAASCPEQECCIL